jgi:hypothetical protein
MGISTFEYNDLLRGQNKEKIVNHNIITHIPTPDYLDFRRGYIIRYFIQRFNDNNATIYEVNEKQFQKYLIDGFYNSVFLEWRLTGNFDEINISNEKSVKLASKKMPALILHLPNYLQFSGY